MTTGDSTSTMQPGTAGEFPLAVYVRVSGVPALRWWGRGIAGLVSLCCFAVLGLAAWLAPDGRGVGTHEQIGLSPCGMMLVWGLPCPTCGYTTSFAMFARFQWWGSFWNQPGGFVAALVSAMTAWGGLLVAVTGWRVELLLSKWFTTSTVLLAGLLIVLAWGWKMVLLVVGG